MTRAHLAAAVLAFLSVVALTPLAGAAARRLGLIDHPKHDRAHSTATPYLGGVAILAGIVVALIVAPRAFAQVAGRANLSADFVGRQLGVVVGGGVAMGVIGVLDDWRPALPRWRLVAEIAAASAAVAAGITLRVTPFPWTDALVTVLWIVGVTNATNLLDHMDGLASGAVAIAAAGTAYLAADAGQLLVSLLAVTIAAAAVGFLVHNRPPARIFMGDAGALALGFLLAVTVAKLDLGGRPGPVRLSIVLLLCGLGVVDTVLVVVSRLSRRLSPFTGGTDHSSHRLIRLGLTRGRAVLALHVLAAALAFGAVLLRRAAPAAGMVLGIILAAGVVAALVALLALPSEGPLTSEKPEPA